MFSRLFRWIGNLVFFGAPLLLLAIGSGVWAVAPIFGPIDPPSVDRELLVNLTRFRDFSKLSPELVAKLKERNVAEFGRRSPKPPMFEFSPLEKKIYAYFTQNRKTSDSYFEANLHAMAKTQYFEWMNQFDVLSSAKKTVLMNEIVDDMNWWKKVYFDYLHAAELPIPTPMELMKEFDVMVESFKQGASTDDVARINAFKSKISMGIAVREIMDRTPTLPFFAPKKSKTPISSEPSPATPAF